MEMQPFRGEIRKKGVVFLAKTLIFSVSGIYFKFMINFTCQIQEN